MKFARLKLYHFPAFAKAYADIGEFTLAPPPGKAAGFADKFTG
jgi:hypothetical protein